MSLDTSKLFLQHQILDLSVGGTTLSGVEAREIIEDFLADALVGGQNIAISYTDIPSPGIVRIMTTYNMTVSGTITFGDTAVLAHKDNYNITVGYDDIGNGLTSGATDNIFIGRDAGKETTASDYSVYIGYRAGYETGISYTGTHNNVFIGREAGREAQWQRQSVFIGPYAGALASDNNSYYNIAIGYQAGYRLRNSYNVVIGYNAMTSEADTDSYQYRNVILGYQAGSVLTGNDNICIGYRAGGYMYAHLNDNVAIGAHAMTTDHGVGTSNEQRGSVALGYQALYIQESTPGSLGYYNVVIGRRAGYCNNQQLMGKDYNTLLGAHAGEGSSGDSNVFVGYQAGTNVSESNRLYIANTNTATPLIYGEFDTPMLRFNGDIYFTSYTISGTGDIYCDDIYVSGSTVHIGDYIELTDTGSALGINSPIDTGSSVIIGTSAGAGGSGNIAIGEEAGQNFTGSRGTIIGYQAGKSGGTSSNLTAIGQRAGENGCSQGTFVGYLAGNNANGSWNTAVGAACLQNTGGLSYSTAVGAYCGQVHTGDWSVLMGVYAGRYSDGDRNVFLGYSAGQDNDGTGNVAIGYEAGKTGNGDDNVFIGRQAGENNTDQRNVFVGTNAGMSSGSGEQNVYLGWQAGFSNTGNYNIAIGLNSGYYGDGNYNIFIGYNAGMNETGSHKLYIQNDDSAAPLIYGEFDNNLIRINGDLDITGGATISGSTTFSGDFFFGANTISGTGDIYCNDLYTSGSTVHIGDLLELSADSNGNLEVNYGIVVDGVDSSLEFNGSTANIGISDDSNLLTLASGSLTIDGDLWYEDTFWDDVRVPGVEATLLGLRDPDMLMFKHTGSSYGVWAYHFDPDNIEEVHFSIQLPHTYKEGSDLYPHLHWSPTTSGVGEAVRWGFEYCWTNINDTFPTYTTMEGVTATCSGIPYHHQVVAFPTIDGTGKKISSMLMCRVFRWAPHGADNYTDDAALLEFDIHFEIDTPGSRQQYIK